MVTPSLDTKTSAIGQTGATPCLALRTRPNVAVLSGEGAKGLGTGLGMDGMLSDEFQINYRVNERLCNYEYI